MNQSELPPWLHKGLKDLKALDHRSSAPLVVHGHDALALYRMTRQFVQDELCELPGATSACGQCTSCRLWESGNHPDFKLVVPESTAVMLDIPIDIKKGKKPSQTIRVDDIRQLHEFFTTSSSRSGERFAVLFPFEALNAASANSLLKSLEEPPAGLRFILIGAKLEHLLPTIRSRCLTVKISHPPYQQSLEWLREQGLEEPEAALSLYGLDPFEALSQWNNQQEDLELRRKWIDWLSSPEQHRQLPDGLEKVGLPAAYELSLRLCNDFFRIANQRDPESFPWLTPKLLWVRRINPLTLNKVAETLLLESRYATHTLNPRLALEFIARQWQTLVNE